MLSLGKRKDEEFKGVILKYRIQGLVLNESGGGFRRGIDSRLHAVKGLIRALGAL